MTDRYDHLREYYADFACHEDDARRVAWRSTDDQHLRFEVLLEAVDDADYPLSILDVGCGVGDLHGYLAASQRVTEYLGIDLLPDMVERAREKYPEGVFLVADLLEDGPDGTWDLVVCSGALNVRVEAHERWVPRMLRAMWDRARFAVAVNFQTTRAFRYNPVSKNDPDLYHIERRALISWCETITPWFALREDYLGDDAAVYLYKGYHRSVGRLRRHRINDPRSPEEQACGLAFLLLERRRPTLALKVLEEMEPTADVLNYKGLCYHRMGDHQKARELYEAALERDPEHYEAKLNLDWIVGKT